MIKNPHPELENKKLTDFVIYRYNNFEVTVFFLKMITN
jgi:hypothetical protein